MFKSIVCVASALVMTVLATGIAQADSTQSSTSANATSTPTGSTQQTSATNTVDGKSVTVSASETPVMMMKGNAVPAATVITPVPPVPVTPVITPVPPVTPAPILPVPTPAPVILQLPISGASQLTPANILKTPIQFNNLSVPVLVPVIKVPAS
jgi:hypothetical protein